MEFVNNSNIHLQKVRNLDISVVDLDNEVNLYEQNIIKTNIYDPNLAWIPRLKYLDTNNLNSKIHNHKRKYSDIVHNIDSNIYDLLDLQHNIMLNDLDLYEEKKQELNETKDVEETLLERINIYLKSKTLYLMFLWCIIVFILFVVVLINLTESKNNINILTKIIIVFITFFICYKVYKNTYQYF